MVLSSLSIVGVSSADTDEKVEECDAAVSSSSSSQLLQIIDEEIATNNALLRRTVDVQIFSGRLELRHSLGMM